MTAVLTMKAEMKKAQTATAITYILFIRYGVFMGYYSVFL